MGETERSECCQPSEYEIRDDDQYEESRPGGSYRACVMIVKEGVARVQKILATRLPKLSSRTNAVDNKSKVSVKTTMPDK